MNFWDLFKANNKRYQNENDDTSGIFNVNIELLSKLALVLVSLLLSESILIENDGNTNKFSIVFRALKDVFIDLYRKLVIDSKSISTICFLYKLVIAFF